MSQINLVKLVQRLNTARTLENTHLVDAITEIATARAAPKGSTAKIDAALGTLLEALEPKPETDAA